MKVTAEVLKPDGEIDVWENCRDVTFMQTGALAIVEDKWPKDWPDDVVRPVSTVYAAGAWVSVEMEYEGINDETADA